MRYKSIFSCESKQFKAYFLFKDWPDMTLNPKRKEKVLVDLEAYERGKIIHRNADYKIDPWRVSYVKMTIYFP